MSLLYRLAFVAALYLLVDGNQPSTPGPLAHPLLGHHLQKVPVKFLQTAAWITTSV